MKTIKVTDPIHFELKRFVADNPKEKMEDVAGYSIMYYLSKRGHKFVTTPKPTKKK